MADRHRRERDDIFKGSWRGRGDLLNATRSLLAARQAQEKAEQRDHQRLERATRKRREQERFPDFKDWLAERDPELAEQWRYRQRQQPMLEGPTFEEPTLRDIRAFESEIAGRIVNYRLASKRGQPAFTDRGRVIDIRDSTSRETGGRLRLRLARIAPGAPARPPARASPERRGALSRRRPGVPGARAGPARSVTRD